MEFLRGKKKIYFYSKNKSDITNCMKFRVRIHTGLLRKVNLSLRTFYQITHNSCQFIPRNRNRDERLWRCRGLEDMTIVPVCKRECNLESSVKGEAHNVSDYNTSSDHQMRTLRETWWCVALRERWNTDLVKTPYLGITWVRCNITNLCTPISPPVYSCRVPGFLRTSLWELYVIKTHTGDRKDG